MEPYQKHSKLFGGLFNAKIRTIHWRTKMLKMIYEKYFIVDTLLMAAAVIWFVSVLLSTLN
jgi:hypothetical protein